MTFRTWTSSSYSCSSVTNITELYNSISLVLASANKDTWRLTLRKRDDSSPLGFVLLLANIMAKNSICRNNTKFNIEKVKRIELLKRAVIRRPLQDNNTQLTQVVILYLN